MNAPYPATRDQQARDQLAEEWIADQMDAARRLRLILERAAFEIAGLDFPLGSPVRGYDVADIVPVLRDLLPVDYEQDRRALIALSADAYERAAGLEVG